MVTLEMNDEEAKLMLNVLERYHSHLEVEVRRTDKTGIPGCPERERKQTNSIDRKGEIDREVIDPAAAGSRTWYVRRSSHRRIA